MSSLKLFKKISYLKKCIFVILFKKSWQIKILIEREGKSKSLLHKNALYVSSNPECCAQNYYKRFQHEKNMKIVPKKFNNSQKADWKEMFKEKLEW